MANKLYIDKSCKICNSYESYINSDKSLKLEVNDINNLDNNLKMRNELVFKNNGQYYFGVEAIIKSMEATKKPYLYIKIFKIVPKIFSNFIYKLIARNRYKISKLLSVIKPKS